MIVWVIGLAGSGKTTVGRKVYEKWKADRPQTVLIDGDEIREIFRHDRSDAAYTLEGRRINADRISQMCAWLDRQDINVVCCILSVFQDGRDWNRETFGRYLEVYLHASEKDLVERRHLYKEAREGRMSNVVGVDIPFAPPEHPDLTFDTGARDSSPDLIAEEIYRRIRETT